MPWSLVDGTSATEMRSTFRSRLVGQKPQRKLFIVSVLEDPLDPATNVPTVGCIMLSIYDPRSRRRTMINLQGNEPRMPLVIDSLASSSPLRKTPIRNLFARHLVAANAYEHEEE